MIKLITKKNAMSIRDNYISFLEDARDIIQKNYDEMDLENVELDNQINSMVVDITSTINRDISKMMQIYFG